MRWFFSLVLTVLLFFSGHSLAVEKDLYFDNISLENGLNQAAVYSLAKDRFGFVWIGTQDGLHRFDGNNIELVRLSPIALPKYRFIRDITIIDDYLYVATTDGLVVVNLLTGDKNYPDINNASAFAVIAVGEHIWLGTDIGLFILNQQLDIERYYGNQKNLTSPIKPLCSVLLTLKGCSNFIRTLVFDQQQQTVWLGSDNGLYEFDLINNSFKHHTVDNKHLSGNAIRKLFLDKNNILWISSFHGLHFLRPNKLIAPPFISHIYHQKKQTDSIPNNRILSVVQDNDGYLWIATAKGLSRHLNPIRAHQRGEETDFSHGWDNFYSNGVSTHALQDNLVRSLLTDADGRIWVGTNRGLSVTNTTRNKINSYRASHTEKLNNYILSFSEERKGRYWIGTQNGLYVFSKQSTQTVLQFQNQVIYDTLISNDHIWVATRNGLFQIDIASHKSINHFNRQNSPVGDTYIYKLAMQNNRLWLGSSNGLFSLNLTTMQWQQWNESDGLIHANIYSLNLQGNNLWIGTIKGLSVFSLTTKTFKNYSSINSDLRTPWVFDIHTLNGQQFLIATDGGIYEFDSNNEQFNYLGITEGNAYSILKDNNDDFWIGSNNGLLFYSEKTNLINKFQQKHGFASNEYNLNARFKNSQGQLMFGTINGFSIFDPSKINSKKLVLKRRLVTKANYNHQKNTAWSSSAFTAQDHLLVTKQFLINWQASQVELMLSNPYFALNIPHSKLDLIDEENMINLSRIDSGSYEIPLSSIPENTITVIKQSHPLQTIWALLFYIFMLLGVIYIFVRYRLTAKFNKELIGKNQTISKQKNEIEQHLSFKQNLNLQIQHSLKSPVFACMGLSAQIDKSLNSKHDDTLLSIARKNKKLSSALFELSSLINDFITVNKDDYRQVKKNKQYVIETINRIEYMMVDIATYKEILLDCKIDNNVLATDAIYSIDKSLYLVLENIISNAIKFSPEGETVQVMVKTRQHNLDIVIKDNGCGMATADISNIFSLFYRGKNSKNISGTGVGLTYVKQLIDELGGQIKYNKNSPKGTIVKITLPMMEHDGN